MNVSVKVAMSIKITNVSVSCVSQLLIRLQSYCFTVSTLRCFVATVTNHQIYIMSSIEQYDTIGPEHFLSLKP